MYALSEIPLWSLFYNQNCDLLKVLEKLHDSQGTQFVGVYAVVKAYQGDDVKYLVYDFHTKTTVTSVNYDLIYTKDYAYVCSNFPIHNNNVANIHIPSGFLSQIVESSRTCLNLN